MWDFSIGRSVAIMFRTWPFILFRMVVYFAMTLAYVAATGTGAGVGWGVGHIFADGAYAGPKLRTNLARIGEWTMAIIKRSDAAKGFELLPCRGVVERTFAWLGRCRRLAKDWEKTIASAEARITIAHIPIVTRRLARYCYVS